MSTNSSITLHEHEIGAGDIYKSIYCHWDGYLSYNGAILLEYYNTLEKVKELVSLGDLSSLKERIAPNDDEEHSFDKPLDDVCVFYHRDRGEPWNDVKPIEVYSEEEIKECNNQEYNYLFKDGKWYWNQYGDEWQELTRELCGIDE